MEYEYSPETGYIFLGNIELEEAPETITIDNHLHLLRKSEFHVSIMALKHLAPMLTYLNIEDANKQLVQYFFNFVDTHDMKGINLTGEFRLVRRDKRVTIVAMVSMPYLEELFGGLRSQFAMSFPTQPAHITLYTLQPEVGIGLSSKAELDSESMLVTIAQLDKLSISNNV